MRRGKVFFILAIGVTALALLAGACQTDSQPEAQVTDTEHGVAETPEASAPVDSTGTQEAQSGEETTEPADATASSDITETVSVQLLELNGSGQSGVATLTAMGDQIEVVVTLTSGAAGVGQPIHIHEGSCNTLGGVAFPLTSVVDGTSTTVVDASIEELQASLFAINVHKSADEISTFVACGNVSETSAETVATEPASDDSAMTAEESMAPQVESNIQSFQLEDLAVTVGTTVTWTNLDNAPHTSTSGDSPVKSDVWDTGTLTTNNTGSITFSEAGTFAYFCTIHPSMTGTVTVTEEAAMTEDSTMTTDESMAPQVESNIQSFQLEDLAITVGTTVTWTNLDNAPHTSTSGDSPVKSDVWDTGTLTTNNSGSITFSEAGTFAYFCAIHPSMIGTVTVTES